MRDPHLLRNAPIREALIDIYVELPPETDRDQQLKLVESATEAVVKDYPNIVPVAEGQIEVNVQEKTVAKFESNILGFRCMNAENNRAVQFRRNGFTMNWLRPYSQWEEFRGLAMRYWGLYAQIAKPTKITQLGVRYINDLTLPTPFESFGEYLTADVNIPPELPQGVHRFLTRVTIDDPDHTAIATITQAFEGVIEPSHVNVILDIDTRTQGDLDPSDSQIWSRVDHLRNFKNTIFFSSLTDKGLGLFE